ncbi:hypothetical protein JCM10450v2_007251 [Rhodotorula kratochvilovae]
MPHARRRAPSLSLDPSPSHRRSSSPSPSPAHAQPAPLRLQVLDVTPSSVALAVHTPHARTPGSISVQLDRQPWPHVAHAGSSTDDHDGGQETTVIVYGLDPGRDYEIALEVVQGADDPDHPDGAGLELDTSHEPRASSSRRPSSDLSLPLDASSPSDPAAPAASISTASPAHARSSSDFVAQDLPDGPPPPYSPAAEPSSSSSCSPAVAAAASDDPALGDATTPASESALRASLKSLRASTRRTESTLLASLSSLRRALEKTAKEDQRARTRIQGLEEAIRRAGEAERAVRGEERDEVERRLAEVGEMEGTVRDELDEWREGRREVTLPPEEPPEDSEDAPPGPGLADLARELDALNKAIDAAASERDAQASEVLLGIEREMQAVEGELIQLDRDEHRYRPHAHLPPAGAGYPPGTALAPLGPADPTTGLVPLVPVVPVPASGASAFGFRWGRAGRAPGGGGGGGERLGRLFRRAGAGGAASASVNVATLPSQEAPLLPPQLAHAHHAHAHAHLQHAHAHAHALLPPLPASAPPSPPTPPPAVPQSERAQAAQQFAHQAQANALWAMAHGQQAQPAQQGYAAPPAPQQAGSPGALGARARAPAGAGAGGRSRAGSVNSPGPGQGGHGAPLAPAVPAASPSPPAPAPSPPPALASASAPPPAAKAKDADAASIASTGGSSTKSTGSAWGRIGTWSQVVGGRVTGASGRGGKKAGAEGGEGAGEKGEEGA